MALSITGAGRLLVRIPTALFPIALGLAGLAAVSRVAAPVLESSLLNDAASAVLSLAAAMLVVDVLLYIVKLLRNRREVAEDISMATRANLLAPGLMAAMVIGGISAADWSGGNLIWLIASLGHLLLLLAFVGRWLTHDYPPSELNPTWFLPAAGIMTSALTWPGYGDATIAMLTLGVGMMLWLMLLPLVFRRLVFEPAVSPQLRPTLFIVAAPFGLAAGGLLTLFPTLAWQVPFVLLSGGAFIIAALVLQLRFVGAAGITLSWWATTFPVAVVGSGFLRLADAAGPVALWTGLSLFSLSGLTTSFAVIATIRAAWCTCAKTVARAEAESTRCKA
jgi:tellurite resistance protein